MNTVMISDKIVANVSRGGRHLKDEFFLKVEKLLVTCAEEGMKIPKKTAMQLLLGVSGNKTCSFQVWKITENFLLKSLENEIQ